MSRLMVFLRSTIARSGYALSYLGGQRQRYRYWGWERCGTLYRFMLTPANIRHEADRLVPQTQMIREISAEELAGLREPLRHIYDQQVVRCARQHSMFDSYLRFRGVTVLGLETASERWRGYACIDPERCELHEVAALDAEDALALVGAAAARFCAARGMAMVVPPYAQPDMVQMLGQVAESPEITHGGNWQVFNWPMTLQFLLGVQLRYRALPRGSVTISGQGTTGIDRHHGRRRRRPMLLV